MKLRELLAKLRLQPLEGEGERPVDDVDPLTVLHDLTASTPAPAPTHWVPSQQDERPH